MIRQIIKCSILVSFLISLFVCVLKQDVRALSLILGTLWGCLNLYLIEVLIKEWLIKKNVFMTGSLIFIKFPLLYWLGYKVLIFTETNPWYAVFGFSLIFMVAFIRVLIPMRERFV